MKPVLPSGRRRRASPADRRRDILRIAATAFLDHGYADVSMAQISAELGGSKTTLYRLFASKADLFAAFVREVGEAPFAALEGFRPAGTSLVRDLEALGEVYLDLALAPAVIEVSRLVVAESRRHPDIARIFWENGPGQVTTHLDRNLAGIAARHALAASWDELAVGHFKALCDMSFHEQLLWGVIPAPAASERARVASRAAVAFLAAYPPRLSDPERGALTASGARD